jgi:hypothetical protein
VSNPANAALVEYLGAEPHGCHPDLEQRLREIGDADPDPSFAIPVLVHPNGVAYAFAGGTFILALRVPESLRAEMLDAPGTGRHQLTDLHEWNLRFAERLGADWVAVDPWPIDVKTEAGTEQLRAWARAAYDYAAAF